jgi:hypothetical protein
VPPILSRTRISQPRFFTAEIAELAEPDVTSPSFIQAGKSVPTLKNCCSWIYREYLVFLCGLCGLCGKTETFGFTKNRRYLLYRRLVP